MQRGSLFAALLACLTTTASAVSPSTPTSLNALFAADLGDTRATLLIVGGKVEAKRYAPGYSDANRFISWSMAKTVTAVVVGELVADGRLTLDAPAPIAEWQQAGDPRRAITLRHLLTMSSGLRHVEVGEPIEASDTNQVLFVGGTQGMAARAIGAPLVAPPGTVFNYSSLTSIILAEIVTRTLTPSRDPRVRAAAYRDFVEARVFAPAGIRSAVLDFDGAGTQVGGSIIYMTLDDWGRFGTLLLDGGRVIAPEWLAFMKTPSAADRAYGGQTWLNRVPDKGKAPLVPGKAPETLVSMNGHLGQFVFASPDSAGGRGAVLVRLGNTRDGETRAVLDAMGDVMSRYGT